MCFSTPKPPSLPSLPTPPSANSEAVREREQRERAMMATAGQGTAATVKTDLSPSSLQGQRKVLLGV
jgi:hypothetical protein